MKASIVKRVVVRGLLTSLLVITPFLPYVLAWTTTNLTVLGIAEDRFYNYDFESNTVASDNVDFPVTMVFWGNAEVNKVKSIFFGTGAIAQAKYEKLYDGYGWVWDTDRGTKGIVYSTYLNSLVYLNIRIYADSDDRLYNSYWGYYVIATTHYDDFPDEDWAGWSEYAEQDFAALLVQKDSWYTRTTAPSTIMRTTERSGKEITDTSGLTMGEQLLSTCLELR